MWCKISQTSVCALIVVILAIQVRSGHLANLEQCRQKFLEQTKNFDFSQIPKCYNASKLAEAKRYADVFGGLVQSVPDECKRPNTSNFKLCLSSTLAYLRNHIQEFQVSIAGSVNALFDGAKICVDIATQQFSDLDQYIAKGCPDN
ncbi:uncharacterized protein LOC109533625 [Dendroctonus ponderosae]|uniref:Secreted protein n=1 Tax=Dendroctonus ponderosae TaxID=77166 RepID=U4U3I1_DENPD|nr:uncharacterized protein LOC109533625 [Dendroctonus ponderosae]ERL88439.1 hypothetical protein D910_05825 [Dendroctonus ponderosae]KAH1017350.1 hypothetical protein HUJ05_008003 [Dendroctonus ponderosae]